jgi:hypothetical protein
MGELEDLGMRELFEEKRSLEASIQRMALSVPRGADWLTRESASAGPIMRERCLRRYHKIVCGLHEDRRVGAVERLQDRIVYSTLSSTAAYGLVTQRATARGSPIPLLLAGDVRDHAQRGLGPQRLQACAGSQAAILHRVDA